MFAGTGIAHPTHRNSFPRPRRMTRVEARFAAPCHGRRCGAVCARFKSCSNGGIVQLPIRQRPLPPPRDGRCVMAHSNNWLRRRSAAPHWMHSRRVAASAIIASVVCLGAIVCPAQAGINLWTSHGPEGGMVRGIIADPQTPRTLYVWGWGCGVFKSTDGGDTWSAVNTGLQNTFIHSWPSTRTPRARSTPRLMSKGCSRAQMAAGPGVPRA